MGTGGIWLLRQPWAKTVFWPWLVLLIAMFAAAWSLRGLELWLPGEPILPRLAAFHASRRRLIGLICMGLALALTTWVAVRLWPDLYKWHGTPVPWIGAMLLMTVGAWLTGAVGLGSPRAATASRVWADTMRNRRLELVAFILIFLLAIFLRIYRLDSIPPGIYDDETNAGLDALYILEGRAVSPFATGWYGTPNGFIYYMAGIFHLFGANWISLKLVSLIPAILTIPAVYFLARLLFGPLAGLSAMFLLTVSRWHLNMSRWGWNAIAPPLFQILAFFFLIRGLRDRRALDYALSGLSTGLNTYTYLSSRLAAATLALYIIYWFLSDSAGLRAALRRSWQGMLILAVAALVAAAPIGVTYLRDPFAANNRVSEISIFHDVSDQHSLTPLLENIGDMLKFFHQTGDRAGLHNLPGEPMTDPFTGLLFAIGVAYAILAWRDQRRVLLLLWLALGLAGSYLSVHQESPQAYRALTALPAVVLIAADMLDRLGRTAYKALSSEAASPRLAAWAASSVIMLAWAGAGLWETSIYFGPQAHSIAVLEGFNAMENGVARETISALQAGKTVYLSPNLSSFSPLRFLLYGVVKSTTGKSTLDDPPYQAVIPEISLPVPDSGHDVYMLLDTAYWPLRDFIRSLYPAAQIDLVTLPDGSPTHMRVQIPRAQVAALQGLTEDLTFADGHHETQPVSAVSAVGLDPGVTRATWTGALRLEHGGEYVFRGDGGLQVFVEGQPMEGKHYLGLGLYSLRVESDGRPENPAALMWQTAENAFVPVPSQDLFRTEGPQHGLLGAYWNNQSWQGQPMFYQVTPFLLLAWPNEQPIVPNGPFSARYTGELHIDQAGTYEFRVEADDGARLTLDGHVLGEGLTAGRPNNFEASVALGAGDHPIQVDYFQQGGGTALRLFWRTSNAQWTPIPPAALTPAQP